MEGLTTQEARDLFQKFGPNELPEKTSSTKLKLLVNQFKNFLSLILLAAAVLSFIVGDRLDAYLITLILFLNSGLGFYQEYKASKELEALRKLEVSVSRVIRDGKEIEIPSKDLVPGDLIVLESGDKVPADGIILEAAALSVNESSLTGESLPVMKSLDEDDNQVYFGTIISSGKAKVKILETGAKTKFGKLALNLQTLEEEPTPLEVSLQKLAQKLGLLALFVAVLTFGLRTYQGYDIYETFFTSIALMVAAVPEGLPTVVTIILALGVRKMYQKKALVRKLSSIESLGSTTVICTDKTGTLTKNEMSVVENFFKTNQRDLIEISVLCNNASLVVKENHGSFDILGDTTEGALLVWAKSLGIDLEALKTEGKIIEEIPFDLKRRMMSVVWEKDSKKYLLSKGAPEKILSLSKLTDAEKEAEIKRFEDMSKKGLRVLAFGKKELTGSLDENNMEYIGLVGIADTLREEIPAALQVARHAGIKTVMVTGDNELTAKKIAEEAGLIQQGDEILTGTQLDELSDEELMARIDKVAVFARVVPEHKLRIIKIFQAKGEIVAVTGDGVNDALALKQAHVGVAMGLVGTDVAKEASDIIILDDNYKTIISAVEEGRLIYSNILKTVKFLLAGNLSEILLIIFAILLNTETPLLPVQILWINFVTDGLPALALSGDKASAHIMRDKPRDKNSSFLDKNTLKFILSGGIVISIICFIVFYLCLESFGVQTARSIAFSLLVVLQMVLIFIMRRHHGIFSNKFLLISVAFVLGMQALIMTVPFLKEIFKI